MRGTGVGRLSGSGGWVSAGMLLFAVATFGCAGDGPSGGGGTGDFGRIQREIFDQSCISGACHSATTRAGGLSLVATESYGQLVDVTPDNTVAAQAGLLRVTPGMPEQSFLLLKVQGDLAPGEGDRMPLAAAPLSENQIELISNWIAEGAPRDPEEPLPSTEESADTDDAVHRP